MEAFLSRGGNKRPREDAALLKVTQPTGSCCCLGGNGRIPATESRLLSAWYPPPALNLSVVGGTRPCSFPDPRAHSRCELAQGTAAPELSGWSLRTCWPPPGDVRSPPGWPQLEDAPAPSTPAGGGTGLGRFPTHLPACRGPAQPTGNLALAGPECTGLCRRNAASVFPALAGQSFPGILPVGRGRGRHRRGNWTPRVTVQ